MNWSIAKPKLEHQEERVRTDYRRFLICIAFSLAPALPLLAQSDGKDIARQDNVQMQGDAQPLLAAELARSPLIGSASDESDLPDAPSAAKPDTSAGEPASSPAIKKEESQGAMPAAMGGPLGVDRSVADRNYLAVTGVMFTTSIINAELTVRCLDKHPACNDVPSSLHSRAALYGIGIPADLGMAYLTYFMKKKHSHIWYVPAALVAGANMFLGVRAFRWTQDQ
jgi:hypothetical protein